MLSVNALVILLYDPDNTRPLPTPALGRNLWFVTPTDESRTAISASAEDWLMPAVSVRGAVWAGTGRLTLQVQRDF